MLLRRSSSLSQWPLEDSSPSPVTIQRSEFVVPYSCSCVCLCVCVRAVHAREPRSDVMGLEWSGKRQTVCSVLYLRNNCERDAVVVGLINSATSLYASISVFSILGFKARSNFNTCMQRYGHGSVLYVVFCVYAIYIYRLTLVFILYSFYTATSCFWQTSLTLGTKT